jgi:hypothetical protein
MPRPQFTLRALLVTMLVVGAFFGGMALQKQLDKPLSHRKVTWNDETSETMVLRDGTTWHREFGSRSPGGAAAARAITLGPWSLPSGGRRTVESRRRPLFTRQDPQN